MIELGIGVIIGLLSVLVARFNLRDYVACMILQDAHQYINQSGKNVSAEELADWAYVTADAFIKTRDRK